MLYLSKPPQSSVLCSGVEGKLGLRSAVAQCQTGGVVVEVDRGNKSDP